MAKTKTPSTINLEKIPSYTHFVELPFKLNACWEWYPKTEMESRIILNNFYFAFVLSVLTNLVVAFFVNFYLDWEDSMPSLEYIAESLPFISAIFVVCYCWTSRLELYALADYINENFRFHSARGLTNITMLNSYKMARYFQWGYLSWVLGSVVMYAVVPFLIHFWTEEPLNGWFYMEVTETPALMLSFLRLLLAQVFMGSSLGHLGWFVFSTGIYFAMNAILICGQLELLCCSIRNARFTAILQNGVQHGALLKQYYEVMQDEGYHYFFNQSEMVDSMYHYDEKVLRKRDYTAESINVTSHFDIYDKIYDNATEEALKECARMHLMISVYLKRFNRFISPLLIARIIQVTLYLCTLLYGLSREFNMMAVEYLVLVAFDISIYCYFGNQITLQARQVTSAAFQSFWHTMGVRPRKILLYIMVASKKPVILKAWGLLPMDLQTYVTIIKTSFSCYTLLSSMNEEKTP